MISDEKLKDLLRFAKEGLKGPYYYHYSDNFFKLYTKTVIKSQNGDQISVRYDDILAYSPDISLSSLRFFSEFDATTAEELCQELLDLREHRK